MSMLRRLALGVLALTAAAALPAAAAAEPIQLKMLSNYSRATFATDNVKVRAKFSTLFSNHGITIPQLLFLKVSNEIQLETDLTFVRQ
jgi:hypothetical protein